MPLEGRGRETDRHGFAVRVVYKVAFLKEHRSSFWKNGGGFVTLESRGCHGLSVSPQEGEASDIRVWPTHTL